MRHRRPSLLAICVLLMLSACSGADLLNALVPDEGYRIEHDLRYGGGARQRLDLYVPEESNKTRGAIVFFYGGGWESGTKDDYRFVGQTFASRNYVTVVPDYRLYPEVRYPAFLEDAAAAVAWVKGRADLKVSAGKPIYLVGHSAGAYIAAMLTLDAQWLSNAGVRVCDTVAASVGLAGPYDFLPLESDTLKEIFGPEELRPRTQPINHVDGTAPPMLLVSGRDDTTVLPRNTGRLAARIRSRGGTAEERLYDGVGHIMLVASLSNTLRGWTPALDDLDRFLGRHPLAGRGACGRALKTEAP